MTTSNLGPLETTTDHEGTNGQSLIPLEETAHNHRPLGVPTIRVFGIGGGGCNAVSRMSLESLGVVEYYGVNTDAQHLDLSHVAHRVPIGQVTTRGLGVGGHPDLGRQAAEESREELTRLVSGADMVFIAAGMGGGTGTGAAPLIAEIAKASGALTVAIVSRPFSFEAALRRQNAELGIAALKDNVDTLIIIPNDRLLSMEHDESEGAFTWQDALNMADSVLLQGIQAIAEVVTVPGEINVDFADVKTIMSNAGPAWLAIGRGKGERRATDAAQMAVKSPLLDIVLDGAKRILFVITGGNDLTLKEVQEAARVIEDVADPEANIIFGTCKDHNMDGEVKVTLVASAFPVTREILAERQEDVERLVNQGLPEEPDELDVPSFLRKQASRKRRGLFR